MGNVVRFPTEPPSGFGLQRVQSTYSVRDIRRQFGVPEHYVRRWTRDGLIQTAPSETGEARYPLDSLQLFRRVRELRSRGASLRQIDAELRGQLRLFTEPGQLIRMQVRRTPFEEALVLHESGQPGAVDAYLKAIEQGESPADAYCNLGILEYEAGNVARAFDRFTLALRQDPRHFESHYNVANLYFEAGDLRLAALHYEIAAEIEPCFSNLLFNLGLVYTIRGHLHAALATLTKAREFAPEEDTAKIDDLLEGVRSALLK